jgi:serine/threonine protein kinase
LSIYAEHCFGQEKIYRILRQQQLASLDVEEQILRVLGEHRRIISFKGKHEEGLLLEHMPNGSVADYLPNADPQPPAQERLKWALHAAEAVAYIYTKRVIHCDIGPGNLLLDKDLNVRVSDFQGRLLYPDGTICLNGDSAEGVKSSMPRSDANDANQKTDIFALGSAIYFMLKGHPPFPELDSWKDKLEIVSRFKTKYFPALDDVQGGDVVKKCWAGEYESADEVVRDLEKMTMV